MGITMFIFFILVMLDQVSKYLTEIFIDLNAKIVLIPNVLELSKIYNTGAAGGMLSEHTIILVVVSFLATIMLAIFASKNDWKRNKFGSFTLTMALAGCVGNFFDRLVSIIPGLNEYRPGVVDMISLKPFDWICNLVNFGPTIFNVADAFLVCGLILFAIDLIFFDERKKRKYAENHN